MNEALTVSQLNGWIRDCLEMNFNDIWLEGEISNVARPSSGHVYFSLKDEQSQIACVLFKGSQLGLRLPVRDLQHGALVRVHGRLTVYTVRGNYQLMIDHLEPVGAGALELEYQKRFERLQALGYFEASRKPPLPRYPKRIGIITSLTAAALQDVLSVFARRNPLVELVIYPSLVQGEQAAGQLVAQIQTANARQEVDLLLLIRGGGSLEDLWAFNDEDLCHAIDQSALPIITGVGHETDTTLTDYCATLRAPTPTAAAELACMTLENQHAELTRHQSALHQAMRAMWRSWAESAPDAIRLNKSLERYFQQKQQYMEYQSARLAQHHPTRRYQIASQRLDEWEVRLQNAAQRLLLPFERRQQPLGERLSRALMQVFRNKQQDYAQSVQKLEYLSPLSVLSRGYALVQNEAGQVVRRVNEVANGQVIKVRLRDGVLNAAIQSQSALNKESMNQSNHDMGTIK